MAVNKIRTINLAKALTYAVLFIGACLVALNARAELRCDCSQIVATCSAEVSFDHNNIEIQSSVDACSRVDYLIDGQPYSALIVDGETELNWDGQPQSKPQIVVENCRVCADRKEGNFSTATSGSATNTSNADSDEEAGPRALIKVMPDYPRTAWGQSLEGSVTVEFSVNAEGQVHNIRVTDSTNTLFVNNTLDAVSRYRYAPEAVESISERFDFRLLDGISPVVSSSTL
jgi:TonB family protein